MPNDQLQERFFCTITPTTILFQMFDLLYLLNLLVLLFLFELLRRLLQSLVLVRKDHGSLKDAVNNFRDQKLFVHAAFCGLVAAGHINQWVKHWHIY